MLFGLPSLLENTFLARCDVDRILMGMYFKAGAKAMLLCERMQQPELSRKSDFGYIAKIFWHIDDIRQFFQDGLPVGKNRGRLYRGFWPLRMRHMGLFKVHSANFSSGLLQRDTTPALMETAGTEKYIVMFRKDNEFARVSGNRVSDIAEEFKRNYKCQGYVVYNVLKESGPNIENYCEWIIEIYFDEYGLSETTDKMAYIADAVDNDGYEVIYAGYKDTQCFPLLSMPNKIPTTTSNNAKESRKTK
ncbi:uncharacterized protein LOC117109935 isoform X2 [Anneissia japonica]|uniref:uncharacterized protein LOC117109935 isoform X2 n=1 Tax=Anneissia japonica TaxID=1529436 RepID=UPI001425B02C|nr:uncharacterized protein LOC117109935 isoform X2 [Anneissia japonica]